MLGIIGDVKLRSKLALKSCVKILKPYEKTLPSVEITTWKRFFLGRIRGEGKQKGFGVCWTDANHFLIFSWKEAFDHMGMSGYRSVSKFEVTVSEMDKKTFFVVRRKLADKLSKLSVVFLLLVVFGLFLFVFNEPLMKENLALYPLCGSIFINLVFIVRGLIKDSLEVFGFLQRLLGAERIN